MLLGPSTGLQGRHRTASGRNPASFGTGPPATRPESLTWPGTPPEGNPNNQNIREPGGRKTDRPSFNPFSHWQRLLTPRTPDHGVAPGKQVRGQGRGIHPAGAGTAGTAHAGLSAPGLRVGQKSRCLSIATCSPYPVPMCPAPVHTPGTILAHRSPRATCPETRRPRGLWHHAARPECSHRASPHLKPSEGGRGRTGQWPDWFCDFWELRPHLGGKVWNHPHWLLPH